MFSPISLKPHAWIKSKGKEKKSFDTRPKKQPWTRVEEEALMRAYIDVSEDSVVGNAQLGGMFLLLLFDRQNTHL